MIYLNAEAGQEIERYKALTIMPAAMVDEIESFYEGWHAANFGVTSSWINARLAKRYAPFAAPYPEIVEGWLVALLTVRGYMRVGVRPTDEQFTLAKEAAKTAADEVLEAANSVTGLFGLPLCEDTTQSGITRGGPRGYSEASPYVAFDVQIDRARGEDCSRRGSGGQ